MTVIPQAFGLIAAYYPGMTASSGRVTVTAELTELLLADDRHSAVIRSDEAARIGSDT